MNLPTFSFSAISAMPFLLSIWSFWYAVRLLLDTSSKRWRVVVSFLAYVGIGAGCLALAFTLANRELPDIHPASPATPALAARTTQPTTPQTVATAVPSQPPLTNGVLQVPANNQDGVSFHFQHAGLYELRLTSGVYSPYPNDMGAGT